MCGFFCFGNEQGIQRFLRSRITLSLGHIPTRHFIQEQLRLTMLRFVRLCLHLLYLTGDCSTMPRLRLETTQSISPLRHSQYFVRRNFPSLLFHTDCASRPIDGIVSDINSVKSKCLTTRLERLVICSLSNPSTINHALSQVCKFSWLWWHSCPVSERRLWACTYCALDQMPTMNLYWIIFCTERTPKSSTTR